MALRVQDEDSLLPSSDLSPMTLLGAGGDKRETTAHVIASQIATMIVTKDLHEKRSILVGLGLRHAEMSREGYFDLMELVQKVIL